MSNCIANEKNRRRHVLWTQQSKMQPDLRMHVCEHSICFLQHQGLGSNPGESMDVCQCIVPLWHGGTLNSHRAATPLVRLVEGEESWEACDNLRMFSLKIGVELSQIVSSPV
ncbi:uncharacterized protein TNCV_2030271 [Trichonephila clavipes]|nr:uncharacterized protein TNCV_2030271 [Trichonephila clavipes]